MQRYKQLFYYTTLSAKKKQKTHSKWYIFQTSPLARRSLAALPELVELLLDGGSRGGRQNFGITGLLFCRKVQINSKNRTDSGAKNT